MTAATVLGIISVAATATGAVMSYSAQKQASAQQASIANMNARLQQQNARFSAQMAQIQGATNEALLKKEAESQRNNALSLRKFAEARASQDRENTRRTRDDHLRFQAVQRAKIAKSGVMEAGSPLDVLAETAGRMELALQDAHYQSNLGLAEGYRQAQLEELGSSRTLFEAGQQKLRAASADVGFRMDMRRAEIARLTGLAEADAGRARAGATLLSGLGSAAYTGYNLYK